METSDIFGYPLAVGDKVIMASGKRQDYRLYTGVIIEIVKNKFDETSIKVRKDGGSINTRDPNNLMSLKHVEENMPELFI